MFTSINDPLRWFGRLCLGFLLTEAAVYASELVTESGCKYEFASLAGAAQVESGDLVAIKNGRSIRTAYYLGRRGGQLLFLKADESGQKFTMSVPADSPTLSRFKPLVDSVEQTGAVCSPLSVLSCLRRLDEKNGLPLPLKSRLQSDPDNLLSEMIGEFGLETLSKTREIPIPLGSNNEGRDLQHDRVVAFLERNGIRAKRSQSTREVIGHIKKGLPALLSAHIAATTEFAPDIEEDPKAPRRWEDPSLSEGSIPVPKWAPSNVGAHAVTSLSVIPSRHFLEGPRILVLDSANNQVNVWPARYLRFARPKYILLYPANVSSP